jgi:hypothetical protein
MCDSQHNVSSSRRFCFLRPAFRFPPNGVEKIVYFAVGFPSPILYTPTEPTPFLIFPIKGYNPHLPLPTVLVFARGSQTPSFL